MKEKLGWTIRKTILLTQNKNSLLVGEAKRLFNILFRIKGGI